MLQVNIDIDTIKNDSRKHNVNLRKFARKMLKRITEETVLDLKIAVSPHDKTGNIIAGIDETYGSSAWERIVTISEAGFFLNTGSKPHWIPWAVAQEMAQYYGMTPEQFQRKIKKWGTRAFPFIDEILDEMDDRINKVIDETAQEYNL